MFDTSKPVSYYGNFEFSILEPNNEENLASICKALSHPLRIKILHQLLKAPRSVGELAKLNGLTNSTVLFHLQILEKATLAICKTKPNKKGKTLVFYINFNEIKIKTSTSANTPEKVETQSIGVGNYIYCKPLQYIRFATDERFIVFDNIDAYNPVRFDAKLICIDNGEICYAFSNAFAQKGTVDKIEFSLELSSESTYFCNDWKSEIIFAVCGVDVAVYLSPGDFGGERGKLTPIWWDDRYSQYGLLVTLEIKTDGVYLNGKKANDKINVSTLPLMQSDKLTFSVRTDKTRKYAGGFNIFGKTFGNYAQDILFKAYYTPHDEK